MTTPAGQSLKPLIAALLAGLWLALGTGCQSQPPLPRYPWQGETAVLTTLQSRARSVHTLTAAFRMSLRRKDGQWISLDGVLAARLPDYLHIQAWKFDQDVFDFTHRPDGTWLWVTPRSGASGSSAPALPPKLPKHAWGWLAGDLVPARDIQPSRIGPRRADGLVTVQAPLPHTEGWSLAWSIDTQTRTIRVCRIYDEHNHLAQTIQFQHYVTVKDVPLPTRIETRGRWDMSLRLHDLHLNEPLAKDAFQPRPGATTQP